MAGPRVLPGILCLLASLTCAGLALRTTTTEWREAVVVLQTTRSADAGLGPVAPEHGWRSAGAGPCGRRRPAAHSLLWAWCPGPSVFILGS